MLKVRFQMFKCGRFSELGISWLLIGTSAFAFFVFVVIFWLEPFTAVLILNNCRPYLAEACPTSHHGVAAYPNIS